MQRERKPELGAFTFAFDVKTTATAQQAVWEKRIACNTNAAALGAPDERGRHPGPG
jgi:hypothetical protein